MEATIAMSVNEDEYEYRSSIDNSPEDYSSLLDQIIRVDSDTVIRKEEEFKQLSKFLNKWFYKPDIEAMHICLSCYAAHTYLADDPVWLFVIGTAGSGKTSIAIKAVEFLENTHLIADLTPKSFSSGFGRNNGILGMIEDKYNGNGVILFPDFTTILSKNENDMKTIAGQMRQIYDGKFPDWKGNKDEPQPWKGKISCIAAVTTALESRWSVMANLGERFVYVRWGSGDAEGTAEYAGRQIGHKREIAEEFKRLVRLYVDPPFRTPVLPEDIAIGIRGLAVMLSKLRVHVRREGSTKLVTDIDEAEMPTRIANSLSMITMGAASLARRLVVDVNDLQLAKRVALDSIPRSRYKILQYLFDDLKYEQTKRALKDKSRLPPTTFERTLEELEMLDIITIEDGINDVYIKLTSPMIRNWEASMVVKVDTE